LPDLTISIVTHNSREHLLACLDSLAGTAGEIVVLDNASEDGSAEAVRERFPGVRLIVQPFRAGFGANHNTVIRATSSRYVCLVNPDTTAVDWGFDRMVTYLDAHPRVAAVGPKLIYPDGSNQVSAWRFPTPLVQVLGLFTLNMVGVRQSQGSRPRAVGWVMGAALLLRRAALDEVGLFDEDFFLYTEEVDLQFRLHRAGWEVHSFPEVTVVHHESQLEVLMQARRINEMWRSAHRYWRKHHSPAGARVAALCLGAQCCIRALLTLLAGRDRAKAKRLLLNAQNAWRVSGPGLRELAEEWNRRAVSDSATLDQRLATLKRSPGL
jgi:GT2 family glycosyltransferase